MLQKVEGPWQPQALDLLTGAPLGQPSAERHFWASPEGQRLGTLLGDSGAQKPKRGLLLPPKKGSVPLSKYWKYQMPLPVPTHHGTV